MKARRGGLRFKAMRPNDELRVVLRTPTELLLDTKVSELEAADLAGRFVVRADCEPVLTALVPGDIVLRNRDGRELRAAIGFGSCTKVGREVRLIVEHADYVCPAWGALITVSFRFFTEHQLASPELSVADQQLPRTKPVSPPDQRNQNRVPQTHVGSSAGGSGERPDAAHLRAIATSGEGRRSARFAAGPHANNARYPANRSHPRPTRPMMARRLHTRLQFLRYESLSLRKLGQADPVCAENCKLCAPVRPRADVHDGDSASHFDLRP